MWNVCMHTNYLLLGKRAIKREEDKHGRKERGQERTGGSRCRDFKQTKKEQMKNEGRRNNNWRSSHEERTGEERKENSVDTSVFLFQYPDWSGSRLALILPAEFSKISSCSVRSWWFKAWEWLCCSHFQSSAGLDVQVWLFRKNLICRSPPLVRSCRHTLRNISTTAGDHSWGDFSLFAAHIYSKFNMHELWICSLISENTEATGKGHIASLISSLSRSYEVKSVEFVHCLSIKQKY